MSHDSGVLTMVYSANLSAGPIILNKMVGLYARRACSGRDSSAVKTMLGFMPQSPTTAPTASYAMPNLASSVHSLTRSSSTHSGCALTFTPLSQVLRSPVLSGMILDTWNSDLRARINTVCALSPAPSILLIAVIIDLHVSRQIASTSFALRFALMLL